MQPNLNRGISQNLYFLRCISFKQVTKIHLKLSKVILLVIKEVNEPNPAERTTPF